MTPTLFKYFGLRFFHPVFVDSPFHKVFKERDVQIAFKRAINRVNVEGWISKHLIIGTIVNLFLFNDFFRVSENVPMISNQEGTPRTEFDIPPI